MSLVRKYINEFDPEWDVRAVGEWNGDPVIWMVRFNARTGQWGHYISRFDGTVILEEEWPDTKERARMTFDAMCGR